MIYDGPWCEALLDQFDLYSGLENTSHIAITHVCGDNAVERRITEARTVRLCGSCATEYDLDMQWAS